MHSIGHAQLHTLQRCNSIKVIQNLFTLTHLQVHFMCCFCRTLKNIMHTHEQCTCNYLVVLYQSLMLTLIIFSSPKVLDLSGNSISSLEGLEGLSFLIEINLEENEVQSLLGSLKPKYPSLSVEGSQLYILIWLVPDTGSQPVSWSFEWHTLCSEHCCVIILYQSRNLQCTCRLWTLKRYNI